jgi:hypothetical protein
LLWNVNTLGSIDTRMNAACVQQFGGNGVTGWGGDEIRRELFEYTFGARFSSWIVTGIQCALLLGTLVSMFVKTSDNIGNLSIFSVAHFMNVVMMVLYGVLLYHAFNNGTAWAWDASGGICAGSYKSSNSQAGVMLMSAVFAALYTVIITSGFPMNATEFVNMHHIVKDKGTFLGGVLSKLGSANTARSAVDGFFTFMRRHLVWIFGIAAFLGSYCISGYMLFAGSPTVESQISDCGIIAHVPTPPTWLVAVGQQTDASGQNMAMGIFILGSISILFTITALSGRLGIMNMAGLRSLGDISHKTAFHFELAGSGYLSTIFNNWRMQNALRVTFTCLMLLMWGRLVALSNSVWMPSVFRALVPGCTATPNFTGVHVWIGFACLSAYLLFNELAEWGALFMHANSVSAMARIAHRAAAASSLDEAHRIKAELHKLPGAMGNTEFMVARARACNRGL